MPIGRGRPALAGAKTPRSRFSLASRDYDGNEEEITEPVTEAEIELGDFIEDTVPETLAGAVVKLRYLTKDVTGRALLNGADRHP
jgi:hypothetical protein